MEPTPDQLRKIIYGALAAHGQEITCDQCLEQLDAYVEMLLRQQDAAGAMPRVHSHLGQCRDCHQEYDGLLAAMRGTTP